MEALSGPRSKAFDAFEVCSKSICSESVAIALKALSNGCPQPLLTGDPVSVLAVCMDVERGRWARMLLPPLTCSGAMMNKLATSTSRCTRCTVDAEIGRPVYICGIHGPFGCTCRCNGIIVEGHSREGVPSKQMGITQQEGEAVP